ncbi:MAG: hypothetical protein ACE5LU_26335 [Anaerolineae bacterium]
MRENGRLVRKEMTVGDAAVDGLFGGVVAGILMAAYVVAVGLVAGEGPGTVLGRFAAGEGASPVSGALMHLAVSAVYGTLFGAVWHLIARRRRVGRPAWLAGLAYGVILLVVSEAAFLAGAESPLQKIPLVHWAVAHGIYGLVLGWLTGRQGER